MDPETRAEWEASQKENPMNSLLNGGAQQQANPLSNFDMAAYLAGSKQKESSSSSGSGGNGGSSSAVAEVENKAKSQGVRR